MTEQVFVGREGELEHLAQLLCRSQEGQGQVCLVSGEAGRGKSALCAEFARRAQEMHEDLLVAVGNCNAQTGIGDPYLPFREVLGMLTGDLEAKLAQGATTSKNANRIKSGLAYAGQAVVELGPDLVGLFVPGGKLVADLGTFVMDKVGWLDKLEELTDRQPAVPGALEQSRIFEQYTDVLQALAEKRTLLLLLDDLQWADAASISLLFHLGRNIGQSRILLLGSYRSDEVALGREGQRHPLEKVLSEFKRYLGEISVDLDCIGAAQSRQFVDAYLDTEPNNFGQPFRHALTRHTGGQALFTIELFRDMQERGDVVRDEQGRWTEGPDLDWETLPARVEGVIEERVGRLEDEQYDLVSVASIEGQSFTAQVVARVQEVRERQVLRMLSQELEKRHHLVREWDEVQVGRQFLSRYRFAHGPFQRYLYSELSRGERRMLHREVAEVLEELYQGRTEEIVVQLARHYSRAGIAEEAIPYLLQAGDRARNLYAYQEAIDYYQDALGFLREGHDTERTARTLMKLGLTYHIALDFERARQAYDEGFALWQRVGAGARVDSLPPAPHALRVGWTYPPVTLDPALAEDYDTIGVVDALFSGLVTLSSSLEVVPDLARSWEVLDGGRVYHFHLRDDGRWSDGTPVTAEDFAFAWRRVLAPETGSPTASMLYAIKGARAYHQGEVPDAGEVGVQAVDPTTLRVELEQPTGYFLHLLAHVASFPVPRHLIKELGGDWAEAATHVGNGPFVLDRWAQDGEEIVLARSPSYCGRDRGNVQRVELYCLDESQERLDAYDTDNLDLISLWNRPEERDRARQRYASDYVSSPWLATTFVGFDLSRPPFDDPRVRQALVHGVDRATWADKIMGGYHFPATGGFLPPGMPGYSTGIGLPFDPERGRQLLAEAGYPGGNGFPAIEFWTDKDHGSTRSYLESQWRENLGLEIEAREADWEGYLILLENAPPQIFVYTWFADYPDPDNYLRVCRAIHWTRCQNRDLLELIDGTAQMTGQGERIRMYSQADKLLTEQAILFPFAYLRTHLLVKPWVRHLPTSAIKWWYWQDVAIEAH